MRRVWMVALLFLLASGVVYAQDGWKKKPYKEWTKSEVEKIASDSPWAKPIQESVVVDYGAPTSYGVTVRLRSALQIRQALVRFNQLAAKYDAMSDAEKAAFDEKTKALLSCPLCDNNYIITISAPLNRDIRNNMPGSMQTSSLESLKPGFYIANESGEKRELIRFESGKAPKSELMLFFPRLNEKGEPLITPGTKKLVFFFDPKLFEKPFSAKKVDFDVSKLIENGSVSF